MFYFAPLVRFARPFFSILSDQFAMIKFTKIVKFQALIA